MEGNNDMAEKDAITKKYMEDASRFADAFNFRSI